MENIAVTGAGGRLGSYLVNELGFDAFEADISDREQVRAEIERVKPLIIINCAAYTAVDDAEKEENKERAISSNMRGPAVLGSEFDGFLLHMSTGFVFDGEQGPYSEDDARTPVNFYGMSKLGGEVALAVRYPKPTLIVRVLDLYGPGESTDFVKAIVSVLASQTEKALPDALYGTPTYIPHLAEALVECVTRGVTGALHIGGTMNVSRYEWGRMIASAFGYDPDMIQPTDTIHGLAPRPANASLDVSKARSMGIRLYSPWEGLKTMRRSWSLDES